jgi:hypothetical protein
VREGTVTRVTLRAHHERRSLEFIDISFAVCDLPKLDTMLADRVFEFSQPELHLQDLRREGFAEAICLFRGLPVGEAASALVAFSAMTYSTLS